jgi:hypothetical protein
VTGKALGWGCSQNKGTKKRCRWVWSHIHSENVPPPMGFTHCKTQGKHYNEPKHM